MVTLLHEFGHIIDLLPEDARNLDGKSVKNTDAVLGIAAKKWNAGPEAKRRNGSSRNFPVARQRAPLTFY